MHLPLNGYGYRVKSFYRVRDVDTYDDHLLGE